MHYTMTTPCADCPFLKRHQHGYAMSQLKGFASGEFPCHKTAELTERDDVGSEFTATPESLHCAGALIFNERRESPHQMMRIAERLGMYDRTQLDMAAEVR